MRSLARRLSFSGEAAAAAATTESTQEILERMDQMDGEGGRRQPAARPQQQLSLLPIFERLRPCKMGSVMVTAQNVEQ